MSLINRLISDCNKIGWNNNLAIIHDHLGSLLNKKNKKYFMKNWGTFREKWKDYEVPVLNI